MRAEYPNQLDYSGVAADVTQYVFIYFVSNIQSILACTFCMVVGWLVVDWLVVGGLVWIGGFDWLVFAWQELALRSAAAWVEVKTSFVSERNTN